MRNKIYWIIYNSKGEEKNYYVSAYSEYEAIQKFEKDCKGKLIKVITFRYSKEIVERYDLESEKQDVY